MADRRCCCDATPATGWHNSRGIEALDRACLIGHLTLSMVLDYLILTQKRKIYVVSSQ